MGPHDAENLQSLLIQTLQAMKERVPDWYGRAMKALADVSENEHLSELHALAYQQDLEDAVAELPAAPGVH